MRAQDQVEVGVNSFDNLPRMTSGAR